MSALTYDLEPLTAISVREVSNRSRVVKHYKVYPAVTVTQGVCGGEPRIGKTRITVRTIVELYGQGESVSNLARIYNLRPWQIENALKYAADHYDAIEGLIRSNASA